jgi:Tfp pilus assembly protein PilW
MDINKKSGITLLELIITMAISMLFMFTIGSMMVNIDFFFTKEANELQLIRDHESGKSIIKKKLRSATTIDVINPSTIQCTYEWGGNSETISQSGDLVVAGNSPIFYNVKSISFSYSNEVCRVDIEQEKKVSISSTILVHNRPAN